MSQWIDVSVRLRNGLIPWPGDAPFALNRVSDLARGDVCTLSTVSMSAHTGTHVDAPLHFVKGGRSVDTMRLDATIGPARVIAIRNPRVITTEAIRPQRLRPRERPPVSTRNG